MRGWWGTSMGSDGGGKESSDGDMWAFTLVTSVGISNSRAVHSKPMGDTAFCFCVGVSSLVCISSGYLCKYLLICIRIRSGDTSTFHGTILLRQGPKCPLPTSSLLLQTPTSANCISDSLPTVSSLKSSIQDIHPLLEILTHPNPALESMILGVHMPQNSAMLIHLTRLRSQQPDLIDEPQIPRTPAPNSRHCWRRPVQRLATCQATLQPSKNS
jgi:hypothetical protein